MITTCVENEYHQIGIKMVSDIFEMNGWNSHFLGSNTPTSELIQFIELTNPNVVAVSLSLYFNLPKLHVLIEELNSKFPHLPILVGGQAFKHGGVDTLNRYKMVIYLPDLNTTELFIKDFK